MAHRLQYRRDTKANWLKYNPVLMEGEVGYETDTHHQKVGDGVSTYSELEYEVGVGNITQETGDSETLVMSQKAVSEKFRQLDNYYDKQEIDKKHNELNKEISIKAPLKGYAPELKVNFANELVSRGVAEAQEIGKIRPTGVISIGDGNATIEKIKGNSVVWNQLANIPDFSDTKYGVEYIAQNGMIKITGTCTQSYNFTFNTPNIVSGHKYLLISKGAKMPVSNISNAHLQVYSAEGVNMSILEPSSANYLFYHAPTSSNAQIRLRIQSGNTYDLTTSPVLYDLTQMFGAGNEPTTIEEFEARKPLGVTDAYNEGEIISYDGDALKSVGFNAWDEEWEIGNIRGDNGENINSSLNIIRSKGYIPVIPSATYNVSTPNIRVFQYDENKKYITYDVWTQAKALNANCHYIRIRLDESYGTTYNHDICIHLVHSGYRNGEYKTYEEDTLQLPDVKSIKDKDGNTLFPYGLLSTGTAHDEITATKAIKRIGVIPLSDIKFFFSSTDRYYYTDGFLHSNHQNQKNISLCSHYITKSWSGDNSFVDEYKGDGKPCLAIWRTFNGTDRLNILDDSVADADELMAKLKEKNVLLYYELAEPIEVELEEPLNLSYEAWDFGTEELVAEGATTPLNADVVYLFNAVDRIRENTEKNQELEEKLVSEIKDNLESLVVNDLTTGGADKALSAEMGKELNARIQPLDFSLILNKQFTEDVESYNVADDVPNITSYTDYIILIQFKYQEGVTRGQWEFIKLNGDSYPKVFAENLVSATHLTHYVMRIHLGAVVDKTAYLESHTNSFTNPQHNDGYVGRNLMVNQFANTYDKHTTFIFNEKFFTGEGIKIYAK